MPSADTHPKSGRPDSARLSRSLRRVLLGRQGHGATTGIMLASGSCAMLSAFVYMCSMTYTLVHHRSWPEFGAFSFALILAVVVLLATLPHLIVESESFLSLLPRLVMWGTAIVLAGLQFMASTLHTGTLPISAFIGVVTVLAVPVFGELAGKALGEDWPRHVAASRPTADRGPMEGI